MKPGHSLMKHYLQFKDLRAEEYAYLLNRTRIIKTRFKNYEKYQPLVDRTLAMIFEKASTRTRVSFEAGMYQMGGSVVHLTTGDSHLGRAEPVADTARVISRMVDLVMIRTYEQASRRARRRRRHRPRMLLLRPARRRTAGSRTSARRRRRDSIRRDPTRCCRLRPYHHRHPAFGGHGHVGSDSTARPIQRCSRWLALCSMDWFSLQSMRLGMDGADASLQWRRGAGAEQGVGVGGRAWLGGRGAGLDSSPLPWRAVGSGKRTAVRSNCSGG